MVEGAAGTRRVPADGPVTVRQVLTHTSGLTLRPQGQRRGGGSQQAPRPRTLVDAITRAADLPLNFHPGERWQYGSSTDFVALLVEKMSGESLDVYLKERIFRPLGMRDTHYHVPESKVPRVAAVYSPTGPGDTIELSRPPAYREPTSMFRGVAGLNSTAAAADHLSPGSFTWGGAWGTISWVDPVEDLVGVFMTQITSYRHLTVRQRFSSLMTQAIIDSHRDKPPKVLGYNVGG